MPSDARDPNYGRRNGYAADAASRPYANPQDGTSPTGGRPWRPRRAGESQIYRNYVPAQGEAPARLDSTYGQGGAGEPSKKAGSGSRRPTRIVAIAVAISLAAVGVGVMAWRMAGSGGDTSAQAETPVLEDRDNAFWDEGTTAVEVLTANKAATALDMATLTSLFPSLNEEYESVLEETPSAISPDDIVAKVSVSGWKDELPGWDGLQLRVRAAGFATQELGKKHGGTYEATIAKVDDGLSGKQVSGNDGEGGDGPQSVTLSCRCVEGDEAGLSLTATVGLSGRVPVMVDDMDSAASYRKGVLGRLDAVLAVRDGGLFSGDFALEGYTVPLRKETGETLRTETWWLYANSNVAPQDPAEFARFVNDMHLAFVQTAGGDVANVDLTVISCDATDPAMGGRTFSELASEIAFSDNPGGLYMEFDYVLRGQATSTTPCTEADLDGRLHPYTWDQATPE